MDGDIDFRVGDQKNDARSGKRRGSDWKQNETFFARATVAQAMISLFDFFTSAFSIYLLAMNYNTSYQWHHVLGELLFISLQAPGAYLACRPSSNLSVRLTIEQAEASAIAPARDGAEIGGLALFAE
jgi:hypothetical protein